MMMMIAIVCGCAMHLEDWARHLQSCPQSIRQRTALQSLMWQCQYTVNVCMGPETCTRSKHIAHCQSCGSPCSHMWSLCACMYICACSGSTQDTDLCRDIKHCSRIHGLIRRRARVHHEVVVSAPRPLVVHCEPHLARLQRHPVHARVHHAVAPAEGLVLRSRCTFTRTV